MAILHRPPQESAHWYSANGEPVHTRPSAEGSPRPTTLADARKLGLFPSVTTVLSILAKPGLEKWKIKQVLLSMSRTKQDPKESIDSYYDRVVTEAFQQVEDASAAGTGVHSAIMSALQGRPFDQAYTVYVDRLFSFLDRAKIEPRATEQTIVNHDEGFAGTMDLAAIRNGAVPWVLDWKTRRTTPGKPIQSYEIQPMQIAAYAASYWKHDWDKGVCGGNVYISSTEPGRIELVPYDYARMRAEWEAFKRIVHVWRHMQGYDPRLATSAAQGEQTPIAAERHKNVIIGEANLPEGTPTLIQALPKPSDPPPARVTRPRTPKTDGDGKTAQDAPKEEKAAPEATPAKTKVADAEKSKYQQTPTLATIGFGKFKEVAVHNVPVEELEKLLKFCKKQLDERPGLRAKIEAFLAAQGKKHASTHHETVKAKVAAKASCKKK